MSTSLTDHLDKIQQIVQDLHTKKLSMTKPTLQSIQVEIDNMRNDIIKFLLPLATTKTSNHQKTTIENSTHHQNQKTPTFANKPTYSAIAAQNPTHATIIINKPDDNDTSTTSTSTIINKISQHITEKKIPATIQRTATSKNNIIIKFNRTDNVKAVAGELQTELGLQARARST